VLPLIGIGLGLRLGLVPIGVRVGRGRGDGLGAGLGVGVVDDHLLGAGRLLLGGGLGNRLLGAAERCLGGGHTIGGAAHVRVLIGEVEGLVGEVLLGGDEIGQRLGAGAQEHRIDRDGGAALVARHGRPRAAAPELAGLCAGAQLLLLLELAL